MLKTKVIPALLFSLSVAFLSCERNNGGGDPKDTKETQNCRVSEFEMLEDSILYGTAIVKYDSQGRVARLDEFENGVIVGVTRYIRNSSGQIIRSEYFDDSVQTNPGGFVEHTYNAQNQQIMNKHFYKEFGVMEQESQHSMEYNSNGELEKLIFYKGQGNNWEETGYISFVYDANGNPSQVRSFEYIDPALPAVPLGSATLSYDNGSNPWKQLNLPDIWVDEVTYLFMMLPNKPIKAVTPDQGVGTDNFEAITFTNQFDTEGKLISQTRHSNFEGNFTFKFNYSCN